MDDNSILAEARQALQIETEALQGVQAQLGEAFVSAARKIFNAPGKLIVTGMGKSGLVGRKIASTMVSTGQMAIFLHPAEAIHGDLGVISRGDVMLAISNSGTTAEIMRLLGPLRRIGGELISITGDAKSDLAQRAELHLEVKINQEACPLGLAPTASTTAAMALGDALAVCLLKMRNFSAEDYAVFHPGGGLGKKLITTVGDIMDTNIPLVSSQDTIKKGVKVIEDKRYGITGIVNDQQELVGCFSMGDFTRLYIKEPDLGFMTNTMGDHKQATVVTIAAHQLAARALYVMEQNSIRALFVVDAQNRPIGIVGIYEILKSVDY